MGRADTRMCLQASESEICAFAKSERLNYQNVYIIGVSFFSSLHEIRANPCKTRLFFRILHKKAVTESTHCVLATSSMMTKSSKGLFWSIVLIPSHEITEIPCKMQLF